MNRIIAHILHALLLGGLIIGSAAVWGDLPERIPMHMNFSGVVDRWGERSFFGWFGLPMIAVAIVALLYICAFFVARNPATINLPNKKEFLELSPAQQIPIVRMIQSFLYWTGVLLAAIMLMAQYSMYRAAIGGSTEVYSTVAMVVAVVAGPLFSVVLLVKIQSRISAERKKKVAGDMRSTV